MERFPLKKFPDHTILPDSFRVNINTFASTFCNEVYSAEGLQIWRTNLSLEDSDTVVPMYTFRECVDKKATEPNCLVCQRAGWGENFVSKIKYHFIIPVEKMWKEAAIQIGFLDVQNHVLHGLIHSNGFGHLLCINIIDSGSESICGGDVMGLWDRICTTLRTRKISVLDNSIKNNMDLRLLYGVTYGHTWFGRWDYKFSRGKFGVTQDKFQQALHLLSTLQLDDILKNSPEASIKDTVSKYRDLTDSKLETLQDLFKFMLTLRFDSSAVKQSKWGSGSIKKLPEMDNCRSWSEVALGMQAMGKLEDLELYANLVVEVLKKSKSETGYGATQKHIRKEVLSKVTNNSLLGCVLGNLNNVYIGDYKITRTISSDTGLSEFSIEEIPPVDIAKPSFNPVFGNELFKELSDPYSVTKDIGFPESPENNVAIPTFDAVFGKDVYDDLGNLYRHILLKKSDQTKDAMTTVTHGVHFTKEWPFHHADDGYLRFICRLILPETENNFKNSVGEELVVPLHATVHELEAAAETAMRDTYCIMENLKVWEIVELEGVDDDGPVSEKLQSGSDISVRGSGVDLSTASDSNYEGGKKDRVVKCKCGGRDDDGAIMVQCDGCHIWLHALCCGFDGIEHPDNYNCGCQSDRWDKWFC